jgi:hypothetical protein
MDLIPNPLPNTLSAFSLPGFLPLAAQIQQKRTGITFISYIESKIRHL